MDIGNQSATEPLANAQPTHQLQQLQQECKQLQILVDVTNAVLSTLQLDALLKQICETLRKHFDIHYIALDLFEKDAASATQHSSMIHSRSMLFTHSAEPLYSEVHYPQAQLPMRHAVHAGQSTALRGDALHTLLASNPRLHVLHPTDCHTLFVLPLCNEQHLLGTLLLAQSQHQQHQHQHQHHTSPDDAQLQMIAARIALSLDNALAYQEITRLRDRLTHENRVLTEEISHYEALDEIIGQSDVMNLVMEQVRIVAATDSSVLILGETGTGKERVARAIHALSPRRKHRMVTMNCAAIPAGLLESDLFGHEKGTFTGATAQHLGRFELAHQGTLFLDEVGDIPLELQPKLLRVLQEREIERLGGRKIIPVDVRVVSATSCDLPQMIADRRYRSDLYYRLNVFPIVIPALRDRPEDIPLLAHFFARKFAKRLNRQVESISPTTIRNLQSHHWPGNVRELQNVIERAVILSRGPELSLPPEYLRYEAVRPVSISGLSVPETPSVPVTVAVPVALHAASGSHADGERERILRVLKETNGIVAGARGAAAKLGLKRTTLLSRMERLGISAKS